MYVYIKLKGVEKWAAGFYDPKGKFQIESIWNTPAEAALRVHFLNGGTLSAPTTNPVYEQGDATTE